MEIDHIFLRAKPGAPEAELLRKFGLTEGTGNKHAGQGTANRRFFFQNAFIELLWIADESEIRAETTLPTMLCERLNDDSLKASPFGICFRPTDLQQHAPFPTWKYVPDYLPKGMIVEVGSGVPLSEPMWFFLKQAKSPASAPKERRQALTHSSGFREITSIALTTTGTGNWSEAALAASNLDCVTLARGDQHLIEITFDSGSLCQRHDFRPALPLVFSY